MENNVRLQATEYFKERSRKKQWHKFVTVMAAVVVFFTTYALIMPAITLERITYCGYEQHARHYDSCYKEVRTLTCNNTDKGHIHSDFCYTTENVLVCETPVHEHTLQCYSDPNADKENAAVWEHIIDSVELSGSSGENAAALAKSQVGYSESLGNYKVQEDGSTKNGYTRYGEWYGDPYGNWSTMFSAFCLNYAGVDSNKIPEGADCQDWIRQLSDENVDLYTSDPLYVPAEGDLIFVDDESHEGETQRIADRVGIVVELIKNQDGRIIGIKAVEGDYLNKVRYATYSPMDNRVIGYGALFGPTQDVYYTGHVEEAKTDAALEENTEPQTQEGSLDGASDEDNAESTDDLDEDFTVTTDTFDYDEDTWSDVIDANRNDIFDRNRPEVLFDNSGIFKLEDAFADPTDAGEDAENTDAEDNQAENSADADNNAQDEPAAAQPEYELVYAEIESEPASDNAVAVIKGEMPVGAEVTIEAVELSENDLQAYFGAVKASAIKSFVAYDIKIMVDGVEWQPNDTVNVAVKQPDIAVEEGESLTVAHVDAATETVSEVESVTDESGDVTFEADGFSVYILYSFTVDFHNGEIIYSIGGKSSILLSELLEKLEIEIDTADIQNVTFSSEDLLTVESTEEGDWLLTSLAAFDTDEALTIEYADGEVLVINVTDAAITGGYWQKVTSIDDASAEYMIVNRGHALNYNGYNSFSSANITLTEVPGVSGYYTTTTSVADSMRFTFGSAIRSNGSTTIMASDLYKVNGNNMYLNIGNSYSQYSFVMNGYQENLNISYNTDSWRIICDGYSLVCSTSGNYSRTNSPNTDARKLDIYKYVPTLPNGTTKTGSGSSTAYTIQVYAVEVDDNGNKVGNPVLLGTTTIDADVTSGDPVVPRNLFNQYKTEGKAQGSYYSSYYGTDNSIDRNHVTKLYSYRANIFSQRYLGIEYNNGLTTQNQYLNANDQKALYIEYKTSSNGDIPLVDKAPDHFKRIDAFRDGGQNPDTDVDDNYRNSEDIDDLYRLYLDVGPEAAYDAVDLLFVMDLSDSMRYSYDATDILGGSGVARAQALRSFLNGLNQRGTNNNSTLYQNGFISKFLALNPENKIAITSFATRAPVTRSNKTERYGWWQGNATAITASTPNLGGDILTGYTNYVAGLQSARTMLEDASVKNDGRKKIMIFLSDGVPTCYYNGLDGNTLRYNDRYQDYTDAATANETNNAIDEFRSLYPDLEIITIGLGEFNAEFLDRLSTSGETNQSADMQKILNDMDNMITRGVGRYSELTVTDTLSDDVDFFTEDLDFIVQKVPNGQTTGTKLYSGSISDGRLEGSLTEEGRNCIKQNGVTLDLSTKTVTVDFLDNYEEEGGIKYSISFNVKTTQNAYDKYAANIIDGNDGYDGVKGDINTDYGTNMTSSDQPGFHSNSQATLTYKQTHAGGGTGTTKTDPFDHPVIQVKTTEVPVEKIWSDGNENHEGDSITATLYAKLGVDGEEFEISSIVLNKANSWKHTFTDLPAGEYIYDVRETDCPAGYEASYDYGEDGSIVITNTVVSVPIKLQKADMSGVPIKNNPAQFELYTDEALTQKFGETFTTDENGEFTIEGIQPNVTYYLKETKAPAGYILLDEAKKFSVRPDGTIEGFAPGENYLVFENGLLKVKNSNGYELPETGGTGTGLLYALGILLTVGAFMYGCILRRKRERRTE